MSGLLVIRTAVVAVMGLVVATALVAVTN